MASTICDVSTPAPSNKKIGPLLLIALNASVIVGLEGLPEMALFGVPLIFLFLVGAVAFLIPVGLVSSELAVGWPRGGGVYGWVDSAFGRRAAVVAVWCQWLQILVWYPTALSFGAASIAYIFNPELAENPYFNAVVVLAIFWTVTLINLRGLKTSSIVASVGLVLGTILPTLLVILFAAIWLGDGKPIAIPEDKRQFLPHLDGIRTLVIAVGMITFYSGLEVNAVHGSRVSKPRRTIPFAMVVSAGIVLAIYVFGSLGIAIIVPNDVIKETLNVGPMEMFRTFLDAHGMGVISPILAACVAIGVLGHVSTWVIGPTESIRRAALRRDLPAIMGKTNANGVPGPLLIIQALIVTTMTLAFFVMGSPSIAFMVLTVLSGTVYLVMYILMFASGIRLRYTKPNVERYFQVPGGIIGMWIIAGTGILISLAALALSFLPPDESELNVGNPAVYVSLVVGIFLVIILVGLLIPLHPDRLDPVDDNDEHVDPANTVNEHAS
ncbi:MAG: APC family permease [Phycisphaerales bacterium]|nr:APC family permease [Phycisphaerales bacterium]